MGYSGALGETDSWKKPEVKNLVTLSLLETILNWAATNCLVPVPSNKEQKVEEEAYTRNYDQVPFFGMTNKRCSVTQRFNGLHRFNASTDFVPSSASVISFTLPRRRDSVACPLLQYPDRLLEVKVGIFFFIFHATNFFKKTSGTHKIWGILFSWRWESGGRRILRLRSTETGSVLCVATSTITSMTLRNTKLPTFTGGRSSKQPLPEPPRTWGSTETGSVPCVATSTRTSVTLRNTKRPTFTGGRSSIQPLPEPPRTWGTPSCLHSLGVGLLYSLYQNLHDLEEHQAAYIHWG